MAEDKTVVKSGSSNIGLIVLALALVVAVVIGFMVYQNERADDNAVTGAASAVTDAAKDVGDAAKGK